MSQSYPWIWYVSLALLVNQTAFRFYLFINEVHPNATTSDFRGTLQIEAFTAAIKAVRRPGRGDKP